MWGPALVAQSPQEAAGEEWVAPRSLDHPLEDVRRDDPAEDVLGELVDRGLIERCDLEPTQRVLLIEVEEHPGGERLVGELSRPGGRQDQQRGPDEMPGEVVEHLPRRGVSVLHVVKQHDDRPAAGEVVQERGDALQEADARRFPLGNRRPHDGDAAQQAGQIVEQPAAELGDLLERKLPEVVLQRLGPQAERRRRARADEPGWPAWSPPQPTG